MNLALTELRRRPGRFTVATIVLTFLSLLLLLLGGLLDGLFLGSTGAIRAQDADVIVYSDSARDSFLRSRITTDVGGLGFTLLGATVPGESDLADVAVAGYEIAPIGVPDPPPTGHAWADDTLSEAGVSIGDTLLVGPAATPIVIDGWVEDTNYLQQSALWVTLDTWRTVQNANRPDTFVADGDLGTTIDAATGSTSTLTRDDAVSALPGVREQSSTFNAIISSTLVVVLAVVGLFFSLLTLERTGLYGVLKAIGASTRRLFAGVVLQAVVVSVVAFVIGGLLAWFADRALSADVPLQLTVGRYVFTFVALVIAAVLGSAISLRRVTRIDPASAIGSAT
jgi:putative ABC transport system permease protein